MAAVEQRADRTYGNWRRPRSPGLWHLGLLPSGLLVAGLLAIIVTSFFVGVVPALVLLAALTPVFTVLLVPDGRHGVTMLQRGALRLGWWRTRLRRAHLYRSGPAGLAPWGSYQLPGLLARSRLSEAHDSYERPFALLHYPQTDHYVVVIRCEPDGDALVDHEQIDSWVAHWGHWLSDLADEPGAIACSVTIESAPDTGARLRRAVADRIDPNSPPLARQVLGEVVDGSTSGSATVKAWVALTFTGWASGRRRKAADVARELSTRLPGLTQHLHGTGAGASAPLSAQELCELVRVAYDPVIAQDLEEAHAEGSAPELSWDEVGPVSADAAWDRYRHDSAVSVTWGMTAAPRSAVRSSVLRALLAPHPDVARKRVTLLYRVIDSGAAAGLVESDLRTADFRLKSMTRPTSRATVEQRAAAATADEEADGAGLLNFGVLITATVFDDSQLPAATAAIDTLRKTARLTIRPQYGTQDSAFAAALPIGLVLPAHLRVPEAVRRAM